jgi:hypothetical protein
MIKYEVESPVVCVEVQLVENGSIPRATSAAPRARRPIGRTLFAKFERAQVIMAILSGEFAE